ncbi:MAG: hypothetical protein ACJ8KO_13055 [Sulfurifustaceae bacterium]
MIRTRISVGLAVVGLMVASGCATEEPAKATLEAQPKILAGELVRVTATVEAVDKDNRILALRDESGELRTMIVNPAVKNFNQIKRGDRINADYLEEVAVYIEAPGMVAKDEAASAIATAPSGGKPSGAMVDTVQRRAVVEDIDYDSRIVTLRAPDGSLHTTRVSPRIGPLDKISKGDQIIIRYTQTVAVSVTKANQ